MTYLAAAIFVEQFVCELKKSKLILSLSEYGYFICMIYEQL